MTCIAWDGKTLAADKRGDSGYIITVTKIRKINGCLVGGSGEMATLAQLFKWYEDGCDPKTWPEVQKDKDRWTDLIIITPERKIIKYEQECCPFEIEDRFTALGSGAAYALTAMHMGMSAHDAVLMACRFNRGCCNGVDTLEFV